MADRRRSAHARSHSPAPGADPDRSGARSRPSPAAGRQPRGSTASAPQGAGKQLAVNKHELENMFESWAEDPEVMRKAGIDRMAKALGLAQGADDPAVLMLAWRIHAMECWCFTRGEWYHGLHNMSPSVDSQQKLKEYLSSAIREEAGKDYEEFYNYVYDFVREDASQHLEQALCRKLWQQLLGTGAAVQFKELPRWIEYLEKEVGAEKRVSRDLWQQLREFAVEVPKLEDHDVENSTYPVVIDDFVEWVRKQPAQP